MVLFSSCMFCFCLGSRIYNKCVPCFTLFVKQLACLCQTFIRPVSRVFFGKTWENCSTSTLRSSGVAFSVYYLPAVLIHPYSFSLHIDQIINGTISHDSHPFRGPDFWTEMRVARAASLVFFLNVTTQNRLVRPIEIRPTTSK